MANVETRRLLRKMFEAAVTAADPALHVPQALPPPPKGRTIVVGAGKASAAMALALEKSWPGPLTGLVVTRDGYSVPCQRIEILEAAHPVPDARSETAARRILAAVSNLTADDLVIALISGGGSSLLALPAPGLSLNDKRSVNQALLRAGAPISDMNGLRRHLSAIKGGRLAAAAFPARCVSLIISDVPGDDLAAVASGPTCPDPTTSADARAIIAKYHLDVPESVAQVLASPASETPKPGDPKLAHATSKLIASPQQSLEAAAAVARQAGLTPVILGDALEGEAREVGTVLAGIALQVKRFHQPASAPCVLLSGGETTVTVRGTGVGGRNVELLLALALKLQGTAGVSALCADTDGVDGQVDVAGAIIDPTTLARAREKRLDPAQYLANNDAHSFFQALNDQVITGPTLTNVNDFRAIVVEP